MVLAPFQVHGSSREKRPKRLRRGSGQQSNCEGKQKNKKRTRCLYYSLTCPLSSLKRLVFLGIIRGNQESSVIRGSLIWLCLIGFHLASTPQASTQSSTRGACQHPTGVTTGDILYTSRRAPIAFPSHYAPLITKTAPRRAEPQRRLSFCFCELYGP